MSIGSNCRLSVAIASWMAISALGLCGQDIASAKDAIGRLKGLPGSVQQVLTVIRETNFGPFELSGTCDYNWQWYCFFSNCNTLTWSWKFPNYSWLKTDLQGKYESIQRQASQFDTVFSPLRTWLTGALPKISQQMDAASAHMQGGDADSVKSAIAQLDSDLNSSAGSLEAGYKNLAGFDKNLNILLERASSRSAMESMIDNDQAALNKQVATYPCGADDMRNKYNRIRDTVRNQFDQVEEASRKFGVTSAQTDKDVSVVLGTVLAARGNVASVLKSLQNTSLTPAGAVQQLRLKVVAGQWRDLSEYARQQFGN